MSRLDLKELAEELDELRARDEYADENPDDEDAEPLDDDERKRLEALANLESEIGDLHVASRNLSPIHEDDFEEHAFDYGVGVGMFEDRIRPYIDRKMWADDLRSDYSSFEFDGETYYYA